MAPPEKRSERKGERRSKRKRPAQKDEKITEKAHVSRPRRRRYNRAQYQMHNVKNITKNLVFRQNGMMDPLQIRRRTLLSQCSNLSICCSTKGGTLPGEKIKCIDISRNGFYLAMGTSKGSVLLYDVSKPSSVPELLMEQLTQHYVQRHVSTLQWSKKDFDVLLSGGSDRYVSTWDANNMVIIEQYKFKNTVRQLDFSPHDGTSVAVAAKNLTILDLRTGNHSHKIEDSITYAASVGWSYAAENLVAVGDVRQKLKIYDWRKVNDVYAELDITKYRYTAFHNPDHSVNGLTFTDDGCYMVSTCDSLVSFWDARNFTNLRNLEGLIVNRRLKTLQFDVVTYGSSCLCYIPSRSVLQVIDLTSGSYVSTLDGHYGGINCVSFSKETMELYSGGEDNNLVLWNAAYKVTQKEYQ